MITSKQNQRIKDALKLRQRRQREKQGRFLIDGDRELDRAIGAGVEIVEAFVCESAGDGELVARLQRSGATVSAVTDDVFAKLAYGDREQGIVAIARMPRRSLADLRLPDAPLIAVLEGVEKPGNLGAVLRTADAAGVSAVVVCGGTDLFNPNTIRASLGAVFTVPVCAATSEEALAWLREQRVSIFAARVDGSMAYDVADYRSGTAIVLGSEAEGLSPVWRGDDVVAIRLPMRGAVDSLNVSASAGILFYEALRQRDTSSNVRDSAPP